NSSPSSSSSSSSYPTNPINEIKFSLLELTFLIRNLINIDYNYLIKYSYMHPLSEIIQMSSDMILDILKKQELKEDPLILITIKKIREVFKLIKLN
ncbi:hypothetical protein Mgra_00006576, partial [Meloidogyne graminicola]